MVLDQERLLRIVHEMPEVFGVTQWGRKGVQYGQTGQNGARVILSFLNKVANLPAARSRLQSCLPGSSIVTASRQKHRADMAPPFFNYQVGWGHYSVHISRTAWGVHSRFLVDIFDVISTQSCCTECDTLQGVGNPWIGLFSAL